MRDPYKDLIETYAKEFNSRSLPCSRSEVKDVAMPVPMPMIDELAKIDMDDYMKDKTQKKEADKEKKKANEKDKAGRSPVLTSST